MKVLPSLSFIALLAMALCTSTVDAQVNSALTNSIGGGGMLSLMQNERVQKELELNDQQKKEFVDLNQSLRQEVRELYEDMRNGGGDRRQMFEELRTKMKDVADDLDSKVKDVLSEKQLVRTKQLQVQKQLVDIARALEGSLGKQLGLEKADVESVTDKAEEVKKWQAEQIAKILAQSREKIMSAMPKESREKLKEMAGEHFDFGRASSGSGVGRSFRGSRRQRGGSDF